MKKFISLAVVAMSILVIQTAFSQITFSEFPKHYQLYPRVDPDSGFVDILGTVDSTGYNSIIVEVDTNAFLWKREEHVLSYSGGNAPFSFNIGIYADTVNFKFRVILKQGTTETSVDSVDEVVCGDAYLINGQSNAVAEYGGDAQNQWVRSFGDAANGKAKAQNTNWYLAKSGPPPNGTTGYIGTWGMRLGILIVSNYGIPVCIIQQANGGQPISYFDDIGGGGDSLKSSNFARLLYRTQNAGLVDDVNAMFWWQGEANTNESLEDSEYETRFLTLYNGWRSHFPGIQKVYTTQIHPGYGPYCDRIREFQRKVAEDSADIEIITPHNIGGFDGSQHFTTAGYQNYAAKLFRLVERDFYGSTDTTDINPPNIQQAYFTDSNKNVLVLEFDNVNPLNFISDTTIGSNTYLLKDHFYFHHNGTRDSAIVNSITVYTDKLELALTQSSNADSISYLPARYYNNQSTDIYDGPWINNSRDVSALTFYKFPIDAQSGNDPLSANIKVYLEGPFDADGDSMRTDINTSIPLAHPYSNSPWNYQSFSVSSIPDSIVDWVLVEIRPDTAASSAVDTTVGFLTRSGMIVDTSGSGTIKFNDATAGDYFIVIYHRNHLAAMSAAKQTLSSSSTLYDFTNEINKFFGGDAALLETGVYGMYGGDGQSDGDTDASDINLVWRPQNGTGWLYTKFGDYDMDGDIDASDINLVWRPNNGKGTQVP